MPPGDFEEGLEKGDSRYKAYLKWLGWAGLKCGWLWEKEPLRVPSTKSWGIIGESCVAFRTESTANLGQVQHSQRVSDGPMGQQKTTPAENTSSA
jgi:tRNASer (uridine44-2'-O)-methyltransferase